MHLWFSRLYLNIHLHGMVKQLCFPLLITEVILTRCHKRSALDDRPTVCAAEQRDVQWPFVFLCDLEACLVKEKHSGFLLIAVHISIGGAEVLGPSGGCTSSCRAGLAGSGHRAGVQAKGASCYGEGNFLVPLHWEFHWRESTLFLVHEANYHKLPQVRVVMHCCWQNSWWVAHDGDLRGNVLSSSASWVLWICLKLMMPGEV